jgi:hypothetical protein
MTGTSPLSVPLTSLTASKTAFRMKRNGLSLVPTLFYSLGKGLFPRVGILHSQRGNVLFPTWELFDLLQVLQNFLERFDEKRQDLTLKTTNLLIIKLLSNAKHLQDLT